jgi:two-component system response regulator HydG
MSNKNFNDSPFLLPGIIGKDPMLGKLALQIKKIATCDRPVFLKGATGTGKELFANAIHQLSHRDGKMVAVNCAAIPDNLFESLLFGHEKGAFSGADKRHDGFLAEAANGTLFLDEIAELGIMMQPKLLRVLESKQFSRIGSNEQIEFTGRIVTATHGDMAQMVSDKQFREDLLYRLNLFELKIPSLEQRREDIPLLVNHFAQLENKLVFSQCAIDLFKYSSWPGNIRQLKNTIDKLSVLADTDYLSAQCIRDMSECDEQEQIMSRLARDIIQLPMDNKFEAIHDAMVQEAVAISAGNKTQAAQLLGVHRKVVERRLGQLL